MSETQFERKEGQVESKLFGSFKADGDGLFTATFSSLAPVVDREGDVTLPSAIPIGKEVALSGWNHSSGDRALPVGRGIIRGDFSHAYVDGEFFTNTTHGRDAYLTLKALGEIAEWSYIYFPTDVSMSRSDLEPYGPTAKRLLKRLDIFEVSPVLRAAGRGTRTNDVKTDGLVEMDDEFAAFAEKLKETVSGPEMLGVYRENLLRQMQFRPLTNEEFATLLGD